MPVTDAGILALKTKLEAFGGAAVQTAILAEKLRDRGFGAQEPPPEPDPGAPTDIQVSNMTAIVGTANSTPLADITVTGGLDPVTLGFGISPGNNGGMFGISGSQLTLADNTNFTAGQHSFRLKATDANAREYEETFIFTAVAAGDYLPTAVNFDGLTYATRSSDLTGNVASKLGLFAFSFRRTNTGGLQKLWGLDLDFDIRFIDDDRLQIFARNLAGTNVLVMKTVNPINDTTGWHTVVFGINMDASADCWLTVDGVDDLDLDTHTQGNAIQFPSNAHVLGAFANGSAKVNLDLAEWWYGPGQWVASTSVGEFYNSVSGEVVNLGATGNGPTGTAPLLWLGGPNATAATWLTDRSGNGNDFTVAEGALTEATTKPPGTNQAADSPPPPEIEVDVMLNPGDDIETLINAQPAGTVFGFTTGVYREIGGDFGYCTIPFKDGNRYVGLGDDPGDVEITGARVLDSWVDTGDGYWRHAVPAKLDPNPRNRNLALEANNDPLRYEVDILCITTPPATMPVMCRRAATQAATGLIDTGSEEGGEVFFFFRNASNQIFIKKNAGFDPATQTAELSVVSECILNGGYNTSAGSSSGVHVENLTIQQFASSVFTGAVHDQGTDSTYNKVHVRLCHGYGLYSNGRGHRVVSCEFADCGHGGCHPYREGVVEFSAFRRNNFLLFPNWGAGGMRVGPWGEPIVAGDALQVHHCLSEGNFTNGMWPDARVHGLLEDVCSYDDKNSGIFLEFLDAVDALTVRRATVWHGGWGDDTTYRLHNSGIKITAVHGALVEDFLAINNGEGYGNPFGIHGDSRLDPTKLNVFQDGDAYFIHPLKNASSPGWSGFCAHNGLNQVALDNVIRRVNFHIPSGCSHTHAATASATEQFVQKTPAAAIAADVVFEENAPNACTVVTHASNAALLAAALSAFQARYDTLVDEGMPRIENPKNGVVA